MNAGQHGPYRPKCKCIDTIVISLLTTQIYYLMQNLAQICSRNKYPITTVLILDSVYIAYKLVPGLVCIGSRFSLYLLHIQSVLFVCSLCTGSMFSLYWLHVQSVLSPCSVCSVCVFFSFQPKTLTRQSIWSLSHWTQNVRMTSCLSMMATHSRLRCWQVLVVKINQIQFWRDLER